MLVIFPSDYFNINNVDTFYEAECRAVKSFDEHEILLFDFDKFISDGKLVTNSNFPKIIKNAIYRGFMMSVYDYRKFYSLLLRNNIYLQTSPEQYERMHIFPNIYPDIKDFTPKILTYPLDTHIDLEGVFKIFDKFIVKDYIKSLKSSNFPQFFDKTYSQEMFDNALSLFLHYRGHLLEGGICLKEFVTLKKYDSHTNEYRAFFYKNQLISLCRNSSQKVDIKPSLAFVMQFNALNSVFYTVDFGELENGEWIILEVGDGQVSGLSDYENINVFYEKLFYIEFLSNQ